MRTSNSLYERIILEQLKLGDKVIFSLVFKTYYKDLIYFATRFTGNTDMSEEIVQDVFVKLWEEHTGLQIRTSLKSYLIKTIQNRCIDWLRHKKVRQKYGTDISNYSVGYENNTDTYLLTSELENLIEEALDKLTPEISDTYRMNRYEGLKYHEIAEKLDVSVRTVEVRIGKALFQLRDQLKDYLLK